MISWRGWLTAAGLKDDNVERGVAISAELLPCFEMLRPSSDSRLNWDGFPIQLCFPARAIQHPRLIVDPYAESPARNRISFVSELLGEFPSTHHPALQAILKAGLAAALERKLACGWVAYSLENGDLEEVYFSTQLLGASRAELANLNLDPLLFEHAAQGTLSLDALSFRRDGHTRAYFRLVRVPVHLLAQGQFAFARTLALPSIAGRSPLRSRATLFSSRILGPSGCAPDPKIDISLVGAEVGIAELAKTTPSPLLRLSYAAYDESGLRGVYVSPSVQS